MMQWRDGPNKRTFLAKADGAKTWQVEKEHSHSQTVILTKEDSRTII
jgi:hypothetical protein